MILKPSNTSETLVTPFMNVKNVKKDPYIITFMKWCVTLILALAKVQVAPQ